MILAAIAPECMVTVNATPSESQMAFLPANLASLPETGQMYGSKANLNLETLLAADPQVVIDLGDKKGDMTEDLNALQDQIGIPVIFIEADLAHMAEAFRMLGNLLSGKTDRGQELADLVDRTTTMAAENSAKITDDMRLRAMYTTGEDGLGTNAAGSIQAQVLDMVGVENAVVVEDVSNKGGGNVISLEQLYNFDPDVILFADGSIYDTVTDDSAWSQLTAISTGKYYEVPCSPYSWLSGPPSMNMILGVWWLGNLIYPEMHFWRIPPSRQLNKRWENRRMLPAVFLPPPTAWGFLSWARGPGTRGGSGRDLPAGSFDLLAAALGSKKIAGLSSGDFRYLICCYMP